MNDAYLFKKNIVIVEKHQVTSMAGKSF